MSIFAVLMPTPQPDVVAEIRRLFPNDHLALTIGSGPKHRNSAS
jgi:hypothetical protein